jgi:hypothetical protein
MGQTSAHNDFLDCNSLETVTLVVIVTSLLWWVSEEQAASSAPLVLIMWPTCQQKIGQRKIKTYWFGSAKWFLLSISPHDVLRG